MSVIRTVVKVSGEIRFDETYLNECDTVSEVWYPGITAAGQRIEVGFLFDPPLVVPSAGREADVNEPGTSILEAAERNVAAVRRSFNAPTDMDFARAAIDAVVAAGRLVKDDRKDEEA